MGEWELLVFVGTVLVVYLLLGIIGRASPKRVEESRAESVSGAGRAIVKAPVQFPRTEEHIFLVGSGGVFKLNTRTNARSRVYNGTVLSYGYTHTKAIIVVTPESAVVSANGDKWEEEQRPPPGAFVSNALLRYSRIRPSEVSTIFVSTPASFKSPVRSTNGSTWDSSGSTVLTNDVCYNGTSWLSSHAGYLYTSGDGGVWTQHRRITEGAVTRILWNGLRWVLGTTKGEVKTIEADMAHDETVWRYPGAEAAGVAVAMLYYSPHAPYAYMVGCYRYDGGMTHALVRSRDLAIWELCEFAGGGLASFVTDVIYFGKYFMACKRHEGVPELYESPDGLAWKRITASAEGERFLCPPTAVAAGVDLMFWWA